MTQPDSADRFHPQADAPGRRASGARNGRRWTAIVAAGVAAILLASLVVRVSAVNALMQAGPMAAMLLVPAHPEARLQRAMDELRLGGAASAESRGAAMQAFDSMPLSDVPLLIEAREALTRSDEAAADRLLNAALRRNPRSRVALLMLLDRDVREGRTRDAAAHMATLTRLFSESSQFFTQELARMAAMPETRAAVRRVMQSDPELRERVLEQMASRGADPETIIALAGPRSTGAETPGWLTAMLGRLVERGQAARARELWFRLAGADAGARGAAIYDPGFSGLPGPPPFNWALEMSADGFAERGSEGLQVEYYGRREARLASQLILLAPGRYRIIFDAEGQAEGDAGRLAWTVSCHPGDTRLVEVPIAGVDFTPRSFAAEFTVPATQCPAQWLRLAGAPAEFPKEQRVTIRRLAVARAGEG